MLPDLACQCLCLDDLDSFVLIRGIVENDGDFLCGRHCRSELNAVVLVIRDLRAC